VRTTRQGSFTEELFDGDEAEESGKESCDEDGDSDHVEGPPFSLKVSEAFVGTTKKYIFSNLNTRDFL
jgi:hypothetical protein